MLTKAEAKKSRKAVARRTWTDLRDVATEDRCQSFRMAMGLAGWETDMDMAEDTGIDIHLINACVRGELPEEFEDALKIAKAMDVSVVMLALLVKNREILKQVKS